MKRWVLLLLVACGDNAPGDDRQGGDTTIDDRSRDAFTHCAPNLDAASCERFLNGRSPFAFHWDVPKLGPLFNNDACIGCHGGNGRGLSLIGEGLVSQSLVRVSTDGSPDATGGPAPVPGFGTQLQDHATVGIPEVHVTLRWVEIPMFYEDGDAVMLRRPELDIRTPFGDELPVSTRFSYRQAPPLIGLGLLEAIDEASLEAAADPDDRDQDGLSGRLNHVWDPELGATVIGRFGWKANTSRVHVQVAGAFNADIGLSSYVFPEDDGTYDVNDQQLDDAAFFISTIAVPVAGARDDAAFRGRDLFHTFGCARCHTPTQTTGAHPIEAVAFQTIHPYTDLLLHDLGDGLTDARPDFLAEGIEWRTPPLWGIGLTQLVLPNASFLHDGRARTLAEAILWHGGEAMSAREAFRSAPRTDRDALIAFLNTL